MKNADERARAAVRAALFSSSITLREFAQRGLPPALLPWLFAPDREPDTEAEWLSYFDAAEVLAACGAALCSVIRTGKARLLGKAVHGDEEAIAIGSAKLNFRWSEDVVIAPSLELRWHSVRVSAVTAHGTVASLRERREAAMAQAPERERVRACFDGGVLTSYGALYDAFRAEFDGLTWGENVSAFRDIVRGKSRDGARSLWDIHPGIKPPPGGRRRKTLLD